MTASTTKTPELRASIDTEEVIGTLNGLVQTTMDSERLFTYAAGDVREPELRARLLAFAEQRGQYARELQAMVLRMGGNPANLGTVTGVLLQGWMDLKSAASIRETFAVLQEVERGEDICRARYDTALRTLLSEDARKVLQRHHAEMREVHDAVGALRDSYRAVMH